MMVDAVLTSQLQTEEDGTELHSREISPTLRLPSEKKGEGLKPFSFIEISLSHYSEVTISLYDQSGEQVGTALSNKALPAGIHQLTFSPDTCGSVPCFYRLTVRGGGNIFVEVKRLH
jgi:hypothetical protein